LLNRIYSKFKLDFTINECIYSTVKENLMILACFIMFEINLYFTVEKFILNLIKKKNCNELINIK
jgi:hypothetical protein